MPTSSELRTAFDDVLEADRFSMPSLRNSVWPILERWPSLRESIQTLQGRLSSRVYDHVVYSLLRNAFLIELVKVPAIETTKVRARWFEQLGGDPRRCPLDECLQITESLIADLLNVWLPDRSRKELLDLFCDFGILPYELSIDYETRPAANGERIHRPGNVALMYTETIRRTLRLRRHLLQSHTSPDPSFFKTVLDDKIKIKTYLTDRALTGAHKTNREKRWEAHPQSVQFALRRSCLEIEETLITQLCAFDGFPAASRERLQADGMLPATLPTFRCPITLDVMSFGAFREELLNPTHGKSCFQVGHLDPLKLDATAGQGPGHSAANISWISDHGNRIQGSLSLTEVRSLLQRIAANYEAV